MVITHLDGNGFLWGEGGYVSMLGGLCEDWCDVVMPLSFLYNSNFMWWTTNYLYEMRFVRIVVWCRDATQFSLQLKFHEMNHQLSLWNEVRLNWGCDILNPLISPYHSNSVRSTINYLYLVPFPTMMSTSSLYTHPLRFRSYSNSMRFIYICSMLESISAMKTLSTLHLQSSSIRRENHQSRFCIYLLWKKKVWKKEMRRSRTREGMRVLLYNRRSDWWRCV